MWSSVVFRVNTSHKISKLPVAALQKLLSNSLQAPTALLASTAWIRFSNFFTFAITSAFYTSLLLLDLTSMRCVRVVACGDRFFFLVGLCYSIMSIFHQVLVQSKVGSRCLSWIVLLPTFWNMHIFQWTSVLFLLECAFKGWNAGSEYVYIGFWDQLYRLHSHQPSLRVLVTHLWQHLAFFFFFPILAILVGIQSAQWLLTNRIWCLQKPSSGLTIPVNPCSLMWGQATCLCHLLCSKRHLTFRALTCTLSSNSKHKYIIIPILLKQKQN